MERFPVVRVVMFWVLVKAVQMPQFVCLAGKIIISRSVEVRLFVPNVNKRA